MRAGAFLWAFLVAAAAAAPAAADPLKHRTEGDLAIAARRVLMKYCVECHGPPDSGRRQGRLSVSDHASLVGNAGPAPFVSREKPPDSQVLQFLRDGSMPPGGRPRPTAAELTAVEAWVSGSAPNFPDAFNDERVLRLVADDLGRVAEKDRGAFRYLSLAHRVDEPGANLAADEAALVAALQPLWKPDGKVFDTLLKPLPKSANTVYRLDLRELRWNATGLFDRVRDDKPVDDEFPMVPFDLLQLEYPFPPPAAADEGLGRQVKQAVAEMNPHRKGKPLEQLRAVPFLRADWVAKALRRGGKPTSLAVELESLAALAALDPKERAQNPPSGPTPKPFEGGEGGPAESVWAWYWAAVPEGKSEVGLNLQDDVCGRLQGEGYVKLRASVAKTVHVTLVEVWTDGLVKVLPLKKAKLDPADKPVTLSDAAKGIFISPPKNGGVSVFYLAFASPEEPKGPPVVVRSRHAQPGPAVQRVLPSEEDARAADGKTLPVARAVVKIEIPKED